MNGGAPVGSRRASEILRFLLVGAIGFIVDAGILMLLVDGAGASRIWSRVPSFLVAVTVTWWLHRHFTFESIRHIAPSVGEFLRFSVGNGVGNGLNLGTYWALIGLWAWEPLAALAVASVAAAAVNYGVSARWVFRPK